MGWPEAESGCKVACSHGFWPAVELYSNTMDGDSMTAILETQNLVRHYGKVKAVDDVSICVNRGDIYGLIGKNGAGKSTLLRLIAGLSLPQSGSILFDGISDVYDGRKKLGALVELPAFYPQLNGYDNLRIQSLLRNAPKSQIAELLDLVGLSDATKRKVKDYSLGMKQRLGIALALVGNPKLLLLDEPINGLDPTGIHEVREILKRLNQEKQITILISSHILSELSKLATRFGIIDKGRLIDEFSTAELEQRTQKRLIVKVSDPQKAEEILKNNDLVEGLSIRAEEDRLVLSGVSFQTSKISTALIKADLEVGEVYEEGKDIEEYFLELVK